MVELPPGARVEVRRGARPVLLARLPAVTGAEARIGATFTDRLVVKFGLPVAGWRGQPGRAAPDSPAAPAEPATGEPATAEAMAHTADEEPGGHA